MRRFSLLAVLVTLAILTSSATPTQALAQEQETPPPELQILNRYVGEWTFEHSSGSSGTHVCQWIGNNFVSCEWGGTNSEGESGTGLVEVLGYDAEAEMYTLNRFFGYGLRDLAKGWVNGDTWTFIFDQRDAPWGTPYRMVLTEEWPNDGSYTQSYVMQTSEKGGPWATSSEASATFTRVR